MDNYFEIPLSKDDLLPDPINQFALWYQQAVAKGETEPSAMTLATVNKQYDVTARMVLLKSFDQKGFIFYTNYDSPKGQYLNEVPKAALVFWWPQCQRQVRITGNVTFADPRDSDAYFQQRDKASRIAALVSKQSAVIPDRDYLIEQFAEAEKQYANQDTIPRPPFWGGYVLNPERMEFWQGRPHRLHDRFEYRKKEDQWVIVQLSP